MNRATRGNTEERRASSPMVLIKYCFSLLDGWRVEEGGLCG